MVDYITAAISAPLAMLLYGMLANLTAALGQASAERDTPVHPVRYFRERPYRVLLGIIAGLAGYGALYSTGQLTPIAAFGVGYMGTDVLQRLADAAGDKIGPGRNQS